MRSEYVADRAFRGISKASKDSEKRRTVGAGVVLGGMAGHSLNAAAAGMDAPKGYRMDVFREMHSPSRLANAAKQGHSARMFLAAPVTAGALAGGLGGAKLVQMKRRKAEEAKKAGLSKSTATARWAIANPGKLRPGGGAQRQADALLFGRRGQRTFEGAVPRVFSGSGKIKRVNPDLTRRRKLAVERNAAALDSRPAWGARPGAPSYSR